MSNSYWKLFAIPGAAKFSAAAFLGRLPAGMISFSIILPISKFTGSYMMAGIVTAFAMIGMALCAPLSGRLVDRYGQYHVLLISAVCNCIGTCILIGSIWFRAPLVMLCIAGLIMGASRLSTGTMARTRWAYVIRRETFEQFEVTLQSAYAFESILDEVVFISAPILATLLCTAVHPLAGLISCLVFYLTGTVALAMQRGTQPIIEPKHGGKKSALVIPGLQVIAAAVFFIGVSAGAVEIIVIAQADILGSRALAGLLMAALAFSSMLSGFWYGKCVFKREAHTLWLCCLGLLVLMLIPFVFVTNIIMLLLALTIAGLAIAPTAIAGQILIQRILPTRLLNEGMSIMVTTMILGMAIGGWLSGVFIDKFGVHSASIFPVLATFMALIIAISCIRLISEPAKRQLRRALLNK